MPQLIGLLCHCHVSLERNKHMKYYSETLDKFFNTEKEALDVEKRAIEEEAKKKELEAVTKKQRAEDAKAIEDALKAVKTAEENYYKLMNEFIKKYGYYHYTSKDPKDFPSMFSIFEPFFTKWF